MTDDKMDVDVAGPPSQSLSPSNLSATLPLPADQLKTVCDGLDRAAKKKIWGTIFQFGDPEQKDDLMYTVLFILTSSFLSRTDWKANVLSMPTELDAADIFNGFTDAERKLFEEGLKNGLGGKGWDDLLAHPRLLLPVTNNKAIGVPNLLSFDQLKTLCDELEKAAHKKIWSHIFDTSLNGSSQMKVLRSTVLWMITFHLSRTDLKNNVLSTSTEDEAAEVLASFTTEESNMFEEGLKKALTDKSWEDLLAHPRLLLPVANGGTQPSVGRPTKRQKLVSEDGATTSPVSDAAATSQTAAHGVGRGRPPSKITLNDAIQKAKDFLKQNSDSLKLAATTEPDLDTSDPFFLDGLGALYDTDPSTKERVVELFQPGKSRVLYNTSGSGKTRLLVEGLCQYWGLYFTPEVAPHFGSVDFHQAIKNVNSSAYGGIRFTPQLQLPPSPCGRDAAFQRNHKIAQTVFHSVLLARLLVFEAFLQVGVDIPVRELRRRWTYLQLVPSVLHSRFSSAHPDIFASVYQMIDPSGDGDSLRVAKFISTLRQDPRLLTAPRLFIVFDEAQICSNQYNGAFHSWSNKGSDGMPLFLQEIFTTWGPSLANTAVLFSGTGSSITKVLEDSKSSVGNVNNSVVTDVGAFVSKKDQAAYIMRHVELDEDSKEEVLHRAWRWLRGRHRFTVEFVHVLQRCGTKNASALLTHYVEILTGYVPMEDSNDGAMTLEEEKLFPKFNNISQLFQKLDAHEDLCRRVAVGINTFMLRNKPYLVDSDHAETIEFGIARRPTLDEEAYGRTIINEPLVIAAALKHFENRTGSVKENLRESLSRIPIGPAQGYDLKVIGMYILGQQLDGTKSLRQIFNFQRESANIGKGTAQLIALDGIDQDGKLRYSIVEKPWLWPFGMCFEASNPSEHERWFKGTGVPFCFPDSRSGHDVGFFVLVDGKSIVFIMDQFKSLGKDLSAATTKRALQSTSPAYCYKDKNGKLWKPGKAAQEKILEVLEPSKVPCLGVLTPFPSNPHHRIINENAPENFALFDVSKGEGELERVLAGFKEVVFPDLGDILEVKD